MRSVTNIGVILLAAGQSSRMNDIKQLLPWRGTFLLQHALNTIQKIRPTIIAVVLGANSNKIKMHLEIDENNTQIIENKDWANGLGNSISKGIRYLVQNQEIEGVLICLADQPLITKEYLSKVLQEYQKNEVDIVASNYVKNMGVPAIFGPKIYPELMKLDSDYGAKDILLKYKDAILGLDTKNMLADIDTPEEYESLYNEEHTNNNTSNT